jgi:hypothetical protein
LEIIIVGLLAFAGYKFFRHNTRAGSEAIRAYAYLEALKISGSPRDANRDADTIMRDIHSDEMRCIALVAKHHLRATHGGKQLPFIGYAYRRGMETSMPTWYQKLALSAPETGSLNTTYGGSSSPIQNAPASQAVQQPTDYNGYSVFYRSFADEVHRLSGKHGEDLNIIDFMEDGPLRQAYRDAVDPLVLAASFCHEHNLIAERHQSYESYYADFALELQRFASDAAQLRNWLDIADPARINSSFERGVHPRLVADGYYSHVTHQ